MRDRSLVQHPLRRQGFRVSVAYTKPKGPAPDFRYGESKTREAGRPTDRTPCEHRGVLGPQLERCDDRADGVSGLEPQHEARSRGRDLYGDGLDVESAAQSDQLGLGRCSRSRGDERQTIKSGPHDLGVHAVRSPIRQSIGGRSSGAGVAAGPGIRPGSRLLNRSGCVPGGPARDRAYGCRRNCRARVLCSGYSTPSEPPSRSVVPGHGQTLTGTLITESRDGAGEQLRVRPVRRAAVMT